MTVKFKTTLIETGEEFTGTMEDLGLCFVSKFTIGQEIILSVTSSDRIELSERMNADKLQLAASGYSEPEVLP